MKVTALISESQEEMTSDVLQIHKPFIQLNHIMKKKKKKYYSKNSSIAAALR